MNLNLGLESLNGRARGAVVPFTPASAIEMQNASEAITNLMASLENYYDAARNAMLVKRAVKKYGKTQSIVALIGQEGLAAAQSFSMEGVWENIKNFLIKIWEKIKEWWGRFWGMFFSVESKLNSFISDLNGSKKLDHAVEFDAPKDSEVTDAAKDVAGTIKVIKEAADKVTDANVLDHLMTVVQDYDTRRHGSQVSAYKSFTIVHYNLRSKPEVLNVAKAIYDDVIKAHKNTKRDIDDYTKKYLDKVKTMKVTKAYGTKATSGDLFEYGGNAAREEGSDTTAREQDIATKVVKQAAKINNQIVASCMKAATQIAVKLMAHTRLVD